MLTDIMPTPDRLSNCCVPPSDLNLLHSETGGKEEKTFQASSHLKISRKQEMKILNEMSS